MGSRHFCLLPLELVKFWINLLAPAPWANFGGVDFAFVTMSARDGPFVYKPVPDPVAVYAIGFDCYPAFPIALDALPHLSSLLSFSVPSAGHLYDRIYAIIYQGVLEQILSNLENWSKLVSREGALQRCL
jgi:hypothetical protein